MMKASEILTVKASGSHYKIGYTVGRAAKKMLEKSLTAYRAALPLEGWKGPFGIDQQYLQAALETFPHLVEELQGIADGAKLDFAELFFLNALEEALDLDPRQACTSVGLTDQRGAWLGHNEDWYAFDTENVIALYARPRGKPAFISVTAAPFLAAVGVNEAGLAQGVNSVDSVDTRAGLPRMFSARAALEAVSIDEAIKLATAGKRAGGYNHLLVHAGGSCGNLETTATAFNFLPAARVAFHSNHYLNSRLDEMAVGATRHSLSRYGRLLELEETFTESLAGREVIARALSDHQNSPYSICRHGEEQGDGSATIFSVIIEAATFTVYAVAGNPCHGEYRKLQF